MNGQDRQTYFPKPETLAFAIGLAITVNLAIHYGIREKTWLEKFFDVLSGGGAGALAGLVIGLAYGGFGVVSGTISFGIGIVTLLVGGGVAGLGLGSLFHIIFNSDDYVYSWPTIILICISGGLISLRLAVFVEHKRDQFNKFI